MHMHACVAVTGQLAGVRSFLSTTWVLGIELQLLGSAARASSLNHCHGLLTGVLNVNPVI